MLFLGWNVVNMPDFPHTVHTERHETESGEEWRNSDQVLLKSLHMRGLSHFLADKPHISCLPREIKRDVLLLNRNQSEITLLRYNPDTHLHPKVTSDVLILTSIPKLPASRVGAPLFEHNVCLESLQLHQDTKKYYKIKLRIGRSWGRLHGDYQDQLTS